MYSPRVVLVQGMDTMLGTATCGEIDLSPRLGAINVDPGTCSVNQLVEASATLPFDLSTMGTYGTDWTAIWSWENEDNAAVSAGNLDVSHEPARITGNHTYTDRGHYRVRLDIKKGDIVISSSVFDEVEVS
jgi:hypothetical protein